ncbi:MAG: LapA family protein [Deltaproteobacteria bacterium]|nr:LapA family protein [Deltaproteobacteria bacterium]
MRTFRRLLALVAFVAALVLGWRFAGANLAPVSVDYLFGAAEGLPIWLALLAAFAVGFALAGLAGLYQMARLGLTARRWRKVAQGLEAELHQLRNLPLAAPSDAALRGSAGAPAPGTLDPAPRGR